MAAALGASAAKIAAQDGAPLPRRAMKQARPWRWSAPRVSASASHATAALCARRPVTQRGASASSLQRLQRLQRLCMCEW